jgi:hypothetical protein
MPDKKQIGVFTRTEELVNNLNQSIREYRGISNYGFPFVNKIAIISKFPRVIQR